MIRLNLCVAIIQTLLCLAAIVAISLKSEDKNDLMISSRDLQLNNEITTYATYNSNVILGLLIAFTAVTALFHYAYTFNWWGYKNRLKKKNNSLRWMEYSITATVMIVVICFASGTVELNAQILIAVMIASSMILGDIIEKTMGTQVAKIATFLGWFLVLGAWAIIIKNYEFAARGFTVPQCSKKISPPSFVAYLIIILVVFYTSFGFVQLYQICHPKTKYEHIEKAYSILSVLSKTALVSIMLWGILSRAQAIDPCVTETAIQQENLLVHSIPVQNIPIYIINMDRDTKRMALFTKPNENIFRFSAFDGQKDMEKIDSEAQKLLHPKTYLEFKKMSPGEKGCTMSHLQLISNIFYETKHECVLICEDDIVLEHYKQKMEKLLPIIPDSADIVQLHIANPQVVIFSSSLQFYKWKNQNWSTSAYLIFRNGMEKLLKMVKERVVIYPRADTIVYSPVTTYTVQPPLFITNESPSTIHPSHEGIHKKANDKILSAQQDTEYLS